MLNNEELYFTRRQNGAIKDKDVENAVEKILDIKKEYSTMDGLKEYVYAIETIINELKYKEVKIKDLEEKNKELIEGQVETLDKILKPELSKKYISKDKIREKIEEIKKDENPSISSFQEYAQEYSINKLQELLQEGDDK